MGNAQSGRVYYARPDDYSPDGCQLNTKTWQAFRARSAANSLPRAFFFMRLAFAELCGRSPRANGIVSLLSRIISPLFPGPLNKLRTTRVLHAYIFPPLSVPLYFFFRLSRHRRCCDRSIRDKRVKIFISYFWLNDANRKCIYFQ